MSALMPEQQSNSNVTEFFSPGPGERLRAARLSMGLDLSKIASELHLTARVVESLEADDYREVGARVFVRGYLRNYARIVDMPVESILRQFDEKWPDEDTPHAVLRESPTLPVDGGPSRGLAGAMAWLLILGSIVLFLMWWRGYLDELVPTQILGGDVNDIGVADTPEPFGGDGALSLPQPAAADAGSPSSLETAAGDAIAPQPQTGDTADPVATIVDVQAEPGTSAATTSDGAPGSPAPSASNGTDAAAGLADATAIGDNGAPVVGQDQQVVMTFSAPCWVDVRDSKGEFKLIGEMPKGTRRVLGGTPPYRLVLGNVGAVSIEVGGEPFDVMRHANGSVARFTLDP